MFPDRPYPLNKGVSLPPLNEGGEGSKDTSKQVVWTVHPKLRGPLSSSPLDFWMYLLWKATLGKGGATKQKQGREAPFHRIRAGRQNLSGYLNSWRSRLSGVYLIFEVFQDA